LQAAEADANARATAVKDQESAEGAAKPASHIAFRAGSPGKQPTQ
jgi:hypothetical protein